MKQIYFYDQSTLKNYRQQSRNLVGRLLLLLVLSCFGFAARAQNKITVVGTVTDTLGVKITGANIAAENVKNVGTTTDNNGRFVLDVTPGTSLRISYVGFIDQHIIVTADNRTLNIRLKEQKLLAEEVVVTAFGKKERKEALVGSVTSIKPAELKIPASNLTNALAGQAAGIISYQRSGQPGQDNASFFIRGVTTFGYKRDPLILIDNVELSTNDLARLNVDDIASFSILKDASATALYGARGANGVILVATKEGKQGPAKLNFRSEFSSSQATQTLNLVDPIQYMNLYNEALLTRNPTLPLKYPQSKINNTINTINGTPGSNPYVYPAVDWFGMLFKKRATTQRNDLNISGGGPAARYYIAGSYNIDNGVLRTDIRNNNNNNVNFKNYQLRSNVNVTLTKTTEIVVRLSGTFSEYNGPITTDGSFASDLYNVAIHTSPVDFPAYYQPDAANANVQHILFGNVGLAGSSDNNIQFNNPYASLLRGHKNSSESRMSAQFELNQDLRWLTDGLKFKTIFNTNRYSYFDSQLSYSPFYYNIASYDRDANSYTLQWLNPKPTGNNVPTEYLSYNRNTPNANTFFYLQTALEYNKPFGNGHNINTTLIGTAQQTLYSSAIDPRTGTTTLPYSLPFRNLGLAGRLTYSYKSRYFIETNFGYNGSERFSANHRYGFFPTIGGSWVISNEKFWDPSIIDRLKIRGSYGKVGNDAIGSQRFFYQSDVQLNEGYNYAQFGINNQYERKGVTIRNYANPDVTWETSKQTNLAVEATLFKNFNFVAEFYRNNRYDILQQRSNTPTSEGLESPTSANLGKVDSKGVDLSLDYKQSFANTGWAQIRANFTYSTNKYKYIEEPDYKEPWRHFIGQPISRGYGYIAERLFVDDQEARNSPTQIFKGQDAYGNNVNGILPQGGDIKYRDLNGDGKIDYLDQAFIGYPTTPEIVYGFGFSGGFKGFDLSAFFQGQARVSFFVDPNKVSPFIPSNEKYIYGNTQVLQDFADSHWSEEHQDLYALYPRLGTTLSSELNNLQASSWWLRNGAFLRLKSVELGYALPKGISKTLHVNNCRIYFNGLNLVTWSPFKAWDPELGGNGFAYPIQKVFNLGLTVGL
ncbi:SusC/RagA family TonB-linked outer membrane protein [Mucilaginibacter celer]|uniref:SusC/RagA family TonB-linked outer membrane protein n=1 Tax=Mucilaginibacter celer TaxID=2305508 RepID=A0A494VID9_9SPHI|nr:TonB-dependent receptor [Mucilaginibacter celer]AYL93904.1 SusC/RagA family TonB-linked outer membrane protein [Mucilaginibacter celer]